MSRRRGQESQSHHGGGREKRQRRQRQLYLVLDDWTNGFSIYKIDSDDEDDGDRDAVASHHLLEPPAVRLESPVPDGHMLFTAVGSSKILIVTDQRRGQNPALIYDTCTGCLAFGPRFTAQLTRGIDTVVEAGKTLYAFSSPSYNEDGSFEVMSWSPTAALAQLEANPRHPSEDIWAWRALPGPPPPHDEYETIASYAVHPDRHTIFMTTCYRHCPGHLKSTYSFDTRRCEWRWHAWTLPFRGPGHFDVELDAWVGLHKDGYVCACRVTSDAGSAAPVSLSLVELDWQRVEEKLFRRDRDRFVRASLTSMGGSRFCLVESMMREGVPKDYEYDTMSERDGCVLNISIFGLKYDHKGQLRTTSFQSRRSYLVSKHKSYSFAPVAFWM